MICPSCCCDIVSRILVVNSWCLTSITMDVLQTSVIPWSTCGRLVQKTNEKKISYGNTSSVLPFRGPVVGGDTFSRLLVAPIIRVGPEKKVAMSPSSTTVDEAWHDFSRVSVSWLIRAGGNPPLTNTARTIYTFWYHILPHEL